MHASCNAQAVCTLCCRSAAAICALASTPQLQCPLTLLHFPPCCSLVDCRRTAAIHHLVSTLLRHCSLNVCLCPVGCRSAAAIRELVSTPQFRHQLDLFSHALMTGQLDTSQVGC